MNILQIVPALEVGGVERGTVELARHLVIRGHKAVVISGGGKLVKKLEESGVKHYQLPVGKKSLFTVISMVGRVARIIKRENIHIVHARSRVPAIIAFFAVKLIRGKSRLLPDHPIFVTTAHGHYSKHWFSRVMGWGKVVIVASNPMAHYMMEGFGVPYARIRLIPRGVDLDKFTYTDPQERQNKEFTIGMIARITPLKGHADFIKAVANVWRNVRNLKVLIVGTPPEGKEKYKEETELLVRRSGLSRVVEFLGYRQDIPAILKKLDLLVSATTTPEAFGRSIVEAMASGVPVVVTKVGGVIDIVKDKENGLMCYPGAAKEMADCIMRIAKDRQLASSLAKRARQDIEDKFSLRKMVDETIKVYEEVQGSVNILVIKLSSIGDAILAIPSLRAIRSRFPNARITVLTGLAARPAFNNCPYIDEVMVYDFKGKGKSFIGLMRTARKLARSYFDVTIDLQNNRKSHMLSYLSCAPKRYGYGNGKWSSLLNNRAVEPAEAIGPVDHQFKVLHLLGVNHSDKSLELFPSPEDEAWADNFLKQNWLSDGTTLIGISPGSSMKWNTKRWKVENFVKLASELVKRRNTRVLITGSDAEKDLINAFKKKAKTKPIIAVGKTTLPQLTALIKRCSVFVTSDSAPMHIAAGAGTPFVALFGATDPVRHLPPSKKYAVIKKNMKCSPCYKPRCMNFKNNDCMNKISVDEVLQAIKRLLNENTYSDQTS